MHVYFSSFNYSILAFWVISTNQNISCRNNAAIYTNRTIECQKIDSKQGYTRLKKFDLIEYSCE